MPHPTGPANQVLRKLAAELGREYAELARQLEKPARSKNAVNISRLSKLSKKYNTFAVPSKVLSIGSIDKPVSVYAFSFSKPAKAKIEKAGGRALPLSDLLKDKTKAKIVV